MHDSNISFLPIIGSQITLTYISYFPQSTSVKTDNNPMESQENVPENDENKNEIKKPEKTSLK